jgi:hypothetical protein
MKTRKKLSPGQPGTKKLLKKYGKKLVCVRYRYDVLRHKRIKTVELIEEEVTWQKNSNKIPRNKIVKIRINYGEINLTRAVKSLGGRWNKSKKVWELPYREVLALGLVSRIVDDWNKNS